VVADAIRLAWHHQTWWLIDVTVVAMAVTGVGLVARKIPLCYTAYASASLVLPLLFPLNGRPLMSMPRFAAVLFPAAWGFATLAERRPQATQAVLVASAVGYGLLATLFINWLYIF